MNVELKKTNVKVEKRMLKRINERQSWKTNVQLNKTNVKLEKKNVESNKNERQPWEANDEL